MYYNNTILSVNNFLNKNCKALRRRYTYYTLSPFYKRRYNIDNFTQQLTRYNEMKTMKCIIASSFMYGCWLNSNAQK